MTCLRSFVLLVAGCGMPLSADLFTVIVDTSSLGIGTTGFVDLQFNPGASPAPAGTATISNFAGIHFTVDTASAFTAGAVSGDLIPGPLVIANDTPFNDYFAPFSVTGAGSNFSFLVELAGQILNPDASNLVGTDFALLLFAEDGFTPLLTGDGLLAHVAVDAAGGVSENGFGPASVAEVPEPSTHLLLGAVLVVCLLVQRKLSHT